MFKPVRIGLMCLICALVGGAQGEGKALELPAAAYAVGARASQRGYAAMASVREEAAPSSARVRWNVHVNRHALEVRLEDGAVGEWKLYVQHGDRVDAYRVEAGREMRLPLPGGNGEYVVYLYETSGAGNALVKKKTVKVSDAGLGSYLVPLYDIDWRETDGCVKAAGRIAKGCRSKGETAVRVYEALVERMAYDEMKVETLQFGYVPDPEGSYKAGSGICYDMASLYAAMLRSQGIPTRMCMGYADAVSGYHAWNEVWMEERWVVVDISTDVQLRALKRAYEMEKDPGAYQKTKAY